MPYDSQQALELGLLTLLIGREARGQSYEAMIAVGWSVKNRVSRPRYWGTDWLSVMAHKFAYSSLTAPGDPNLLVYPDLGQSAWQAVLKAAEAVYSADGPDPTGGATHYYSINIPAPSWAIAPDSAFTVQVGAFRFFRAT